MRTRLLLLSTLFFLTHYLLEGQCPEDQNILSSQYEVDQFGEQYPNCEELGALTIGNWGENTNISNLEGLQSLKSISYQLTIVNNPMLSGLTGLDSLTHINSFTLYNNDLLTDLSGLDNVSGEFTQGGIKILLNENLQSISQLQNLEGVAAYLDIMNNNSLINLEGLNGITGVHSWGDGGIRIYDNASLESLEGLENLEFNTVVPLVGPNDPIPEYFHVQIYNNDNLTSLNGLGKFNHAFNMKVKYNDALPNLDGLQNQDSLSHLLVNSNNGLTSLHGLKPNMKFPWLELVGNDGLIDLNGLDSLASVGILEIDYNESFSSLNGLPDSSTVYIRGNNSLKDLSGISDINYVHLLNLRSNASLTNLNGIENIEHLNILHCAGNDLLTSLEGLEHFDYLNALMLSSNHSLVDLSDLQQIDSINTLSINNHHNLQSLDGLGHENTNFEQVVIINNPLLSTCNAPSICNFLENFSGDPQMVFIDNNAVGCNSQQEVEAACMVPLNEIQASADIYIAPNPASGFFEIKLKNKPIEHLRIFDITGRLINDFQFEKVSSATINTTDWNKGIYLIIVNGEYLSKLVIEQ